MNISCRFFVVFLCIAPIAAGTVSQAASVSTVSNHVKYSVLHKLGDVIYKFSEIIFYVGSYVHGDEEPHVGSDIHGDEEPHGAYKKENKNKLSHVVGDFIMDVGISGGKKTLKLKKLENRIFSKMNHTETQRIFTFYNLRDL